MALITISGGMNDYSQIRSGSERDPYRKKLSPAESIQRHLASRAWLLEESKIQKIAEKKIVVVTHNLPLYESISEHLSADRLNPAFASNMENEMAEIGAERGSTAILIIRQIILLHAGYEWCAIPAVMRGSMRT